MKNKYFTCIAKGNTYPVKDDLISWGFGWRPEYRAWIREGIDEDDLRLFNAFVKGITEKKIPPKWPGVILAFVEEPRNYIDDAIDEFIRGIDNGKD